MNLQLLKKLLRDLWVRKVSLGALTFVGILGVSFLIAMFGVYFDLRNARDAFYRDYRLADFRISIKAAPENLLPALAEIPGVESLAGTVSLPGRIQLSDFPDPIQATLVALPPGEAQFHRLKPLTGDGLESLRPGQVYLSSAFYRAHDLKRGDELSLVLLGNQERLKAVGGVQSPEWVYVLAPGGSLAPDPLRSSVLFMPLRQLQEAGELENSYNQILGRFQSHVRGHPEREREVLEALQDRLHVYGVLEAVTQEEFLSVQFLESDIAGLKVSAAIMPTLCLIIVSVVLNVVIGRLVSSQRTVIGTLKALGYSNFSITGHYLGFGLAVGIGAAVGGIVVGRWLQEMLLGIYRSVYELPIDRSLFYPDLVGIAVGLSLIFALLGTLFGVLSATRLPPASAMRPPPPEKGGKILLERGPLRRLWSRLSFAPKLVLRAVFRNPMRSGVTFASAFVATAIMVESIAVGQAITVLIDKEFRFSQRQDATVTLREPLSVQHLKREIERLPGVELHEGQLSVPARISRADRNDAPRREVIVTGLPSSPQLQNPIKHNPELASLLKDGQRGLFLSRKLATVLGVVPGETLSVELRRGTRRTVQLPVLGLVDTSLGLGAYTRSDLLSREIGETEVWDRVLLLVDPLQREELNRVVAEQPEVLSVTWRSDSLAQMQKTLEENMGTGLVVITIFCGFLAFGAVLNTALVAVSEREREIGTLRVLGYTPLQVTALFSGEILLLNSIGVTFGWLGGTLLTYGVTRAYDTEIFRFPFVMGTDVLVEATLKMSIFLLASQFVMARIIAGLNWLDVLKIRE